MADLDVLPTGDVVTALLDAEERVLPAVRAATPRIAAAAELIADRMRAGGRLALVGAGNSGRLAILQATELPDTFGLPRDRIIGRAAGGSIGTAAAEDDAEAGRRDAENLRLTAADVLVAVAASGRTPYTLVVAEVAAAAGAAVVSVTTTVPSPLAQRAALAIEVPVGPEVLSGSTRLTAGSAQKIVLDAVTTAAMARLGRVHGGLMLDVVPANAKLRDRSAGLVAEIAGCDVETARDALSRCDWNARAAVLHVLFALPPADAAAHAAAHPTLRGAIGART